MKAASPATRKLFSFFGIILVAGIAFFITQTEAAGLPEVNDFAREKSQPQPTARIKSLLLQPEKSVALSNSLLSDIFETTAIQSNERRAKETNEFESTQVSTDSKTKIKDEKAFDRLIAEAQNKGKVRVIVGLNVDFVPEGNLAESDLVENQRASISAAQDKLVERIKQFGVEKIKKFDFIPYMAFETDANAVAFMKYSPEVNFIQEDAVRDATLLESTRLSGAYYSWLAGLGGAGWTVAILDTGVDKNHPFLSGKVVSEACYSTTTTDYTSVCPGGVSSSTASGSGVHCSTSITGCDHGTHVAGIAAGNNASSDADGVARDSSIIAVQVFSRRVSTNEARTFTSDYILGLQRVYALRNTYNIAAVNMSLGGGGFTSACDSSEAATKTAIDNLRSAGIATVIASGNDGYVNGMSAPACISTAISVGSVRDGGSNVSTGSVDTPSSFSNSASFLSLLAPGEWINSSVPGTGYADKQGTSMAAPHVAGAWAILKQRMGGAATVQQILDRLNNTGISVTDSRNNITKKSIRIDTAVYVGCSPSLSSTTANFNSSGGNGSYNLTITGCGWTAASSVPWITTSSSGNASGTINYTVAANNTTSSRTGTISVAGQRFAVTQSGVSCTPSLSSSSATVPGSGGSGSFTVNSPSACGGWTASSNQSWAGITSNGIDTLTYTVGPNNTGATRTATITVNAPGGTLYFTLTQGICASSLSSNNLTWGDEGGSSYINVYMPAGCTWTTSSNQSWLKVTSGGSGSGNGQFIYTVDPNTSATSRTATITVSGGSAFNVLQTAAPACTYSLGSTGRIVDADADNFSFSVSTNRNHCSWSSSVTSGNSWLSISSGSGTGSGSVNFSVTANPSAANARIGTITAAGQTYTVRQSAANVPCSPVTSDLIGWYRGENNTNDIIGANDPGTFTGAVTYLGGRSGQAMNFDGGDALAIQRLIGDDFSIEFWLKTTQTGGSGETNWYTGAGLVDAEVANITNDFGVSLGNGKIMFGVGNPDTTIRSAAAVNDNLWHHVVATRNRSSGAIRLYIDGALSASGTGGTQTLNAPATIALGRLQTGAFYAGQLDEIKIYNGDLSATQVTSAYNGCGGATPSVSIADRSINEGNSGTTNANFTVSLSAAAAQNVSVAYATQDVTATAGSDYTATSGTLTILAGQTSGTISVPVIGDTSMESNETFKVVLSNAANATIADNEGLGTIINDDSSCNYSISPTFYIFPSTSGTLNIQVTAPGGCAWTASTALNWVSITSGSSGSGNGTVTISVPPNTSANARTGLIYIAGNDFSVGQQGAALNLTITGVVYYGTTPATQAAKYVAGVSLLARGPSDLTASTNSAGEYLLSGFTANDQYVVFPSKTGNANGISPFDATLVLRHVAAGGQGANALNANQQLAADANGSNSISPFDATLILRYVAAGGSNPNTGQVGNWKFAPEYLYYSSMTGSFTNQNYAAILIGEVNGSWTAP